MVVGWASKLGYSQRQRVGGPAGGAVHSRARPGGCHPLAPSYCLVTRSLAQVQGVGVGGKLGVRQGSSSAVVPLDDESLAIVWSHVGLSLLVEFLFLVLILRVVLMFILRVVRCE